MRLLLDKGIVAKDEFVSLQQQTTAQEDTLVTAQQDLDETLKRGDARNLRVAELALQTAQARMDTIRAQQHMQVIRSPFRGILMHPPATEAQDRAEGKLIAPGTHVSKGQALAMVGDTEQFAVEAHVDEIDIGKMRIGQEFTVIGDSFPGPQRPGVAAFHSAGGFFDK
jgi:multidrug resistance efflux pump